MPKVTDTELQELVDDGTITAITIDTTEFHHFGYHLEARSLVSLEQFKATNIKVVLSEMVLGEVHAHMTQRMAEAAEKARTGINQFLKEWRHDRDRGAIAAELGLDVNPGASARALLDAFVRRVDAQTVSVDLGVSIRELHDRYFSARPPFSARSDKKNEFPDAMALLSLEAWARDSGRVVLAVSNDGDWAAFAEQSEHIVCLPKIAPALSLFNREESVFAARVAAGLRSGAAARLHAAIESKLERLVEIFEVEANAPYFYEEEAGLSRVVSWRIDDDTVFDIVASDGDSVTLAFQVKLEAEFKAHFTFLRWDSEDREYVKVGRSLEQIVDTLDVPITATVPTGDGDDPEPIEVEAESWSVSIDFGYVEPDYERD